MSYIRIEIIINAQAHIFHLIKFMFVFFSLVCLVVLVVCNVCLCVRPRCGQSATHLVDLHFFFAVGFLFGLVSETLHKNYDEFIYHTIYLVWQTHLTINERKTVRAHTHTHAHVTAKHLRVIRIFNLFMFFFVFRSMSKQSRMIARQQQTYAHA